MCTLTSQSNNLDPSCIPESIRLAIQPTHEIISLRACSSCKGHAKTSIINPAKKPPSPLSLLTIELPSHTPSTLFTRLSLRFLAIASTPLVRIYYFLGPINNSTGTRVLLLAVSSVRDHSHSCLFKRVLSNGFPDRVIAADGKIVDGTLMLESPLCDAEGIVTVGTRDRRVKYSNGADIYNTETFMVDLRSYVTSGEALEKPTTTPNSL